MRDIFLTLDTDIISRAIHDLDLRRAEISGEMQGAEMKFENIIGSDHHPDITPDEQIARLASIRDELETILDIVVNEKELGNISGEAIVVLTSYEDQEDWDVLDVPHAPFGTGMACAELIEAAMLGHEIFEDILSYLADEGPVPEITLEKYFRAYDRYKPEEGFAGEDDDDIHFIETSMTYLRALIDNPDLAWKGQVEVPKILIKHVLKPCLAQVRPALRLH